MKKLIFLLENLAIIHISCMHMQENVTIIVALRLLLNNRIPPFFSTSPFSCTPMPTSSTAGTHKAKHKANWRWRKSKKSYSSKTPRPSHPLKDGMTTKMTKSARVCGPTGLQGPVAMAMGVSLTSRLKLTRLLYVIWQLCIHNWHL